MRVLKSWNLGLKKKFKMSLFIIVIQLCYDVVRPFFLLEMGQNQQPLLTSGSGKKSEFGKKTNKYLNTHTNLA